MPRIINIPKEGDKTGMLTFIKLDGVNQRWDKMGVYKCECGEICRTKISRVNGGYTKSCGCYKKTNIGKSTKTHGLSNHPLYWVWSSIIDRCENANNGRYSDYGGRGVYICKSWRNDFQKFYKWAIASGWEQGMEIDKDILPFKFGLPGLVYCPEMCSVVSQKTNQNTTRASKMLTYKSRTQSVSMWAEETGTSPFLIYKRLKRGWSVEDALETPNISGQKLSFNKRNQTN